MIEYTQNLKYVINLFNILNHLKTKLIIYLSLSHFIMIKSLRRLFSKSDIEKIVSQLKLETVVTQIDIKENSVNLHMKLD